MATFGNDERLPKQFGDFSEQLVMYILGHHKNMRVALVDHVGADIIAVKDNKKYAISVKGRNFLDIDNKFSESHSTHFKGNDIEKLVDFSNSFDMVPAVAFVFTDNDIDKDKVTIRVFIISLEKMEEMANDESIHFLNKSKSKIQGVTFNIGKNKRSLLGEIIKYSNYIDYTEIKINKTDNELHI